MGFSTFSALWRHPEFRRGARDISGVTLGISAWGLVTGVAMVKSGLSVPLALLMSFVVFAGSAQLAALPLLASGAPMWVLWRRLFASICASSSSACSGVPTLASCPVPSGC